MKVKKVLTKYIGKISPKLYFILAYAHNRGRLPNLKNPSDISEIAIKQVLDGEINKRSWLADKYAVREYVKNKGLDYILTPLIGVYDSTKDLNLDLLPQKFALKMNYGAGMNIICRNKDNLNFEATILKLNKWLNSSQNYSYSERHYNLIPHKIICEEFIDDGNGGFPTDYKFMCANGKVMCILAVSGREVGHSHYAPYDVKWNLLPHYDKLNRRIDIKQPKNLKHMIAIAEKLSKGLDFVRIDLYSNGDKVWFGEITLTPAGCIFHGWTDEAINEMGEFYRNTL